MRNSIFILLYAMFVSCQSGVTEHQPDIDENESDYTVLTVNPNVKYQNVVGFGGYMNCDWVGSANMLTVDQIAKFYSPTALGYTIIRTRIYPEKEKWGTHVAHLKKAQELGAILFAAAWSPPNNMIQRRDTPKYSNVNYLPAENYTQYAAHLKSYIDYMASNGVRIDILSIQNEPDGQFCHWYPQELVAFIKAYGDDLGDVKIMLAEAFGFNKSYTDLILNDAQALAKVDIIAGHIYGSGLVDYPLARQKGRDVWMSEHLLNEESLPDANYPEGVASLSWLPSLNYVATEIHRCMEANFSTYMWWYLKRYYSMMGDNDSRSPVAQGEITKRGYILSHYAKYASDTKRIMIERDAVVKQPLATAYVADDGVRLVIINQDASQCKLKIVMPQKIISASVVETTSIKNMQPVSVFVSNDKTAIKTTLARYSITSVKIVL